MNPNELYIRKINKKEEAPLDSYLIYNIDGGVYYVPYNEYSNFTTQWLGKGPKPPLTMDLAFARSHALILDLDFKSTRSHVVKTSEETLAVIETVLKSFFIPGIPNFTYIIARREDGAGIHIHLPEMVIAHDDYVILCQDLQPKLKHSVREGYYELDILRNASLYGAGKPGNPCCYRPVQMVYVSEKKSLVCDLKDMVHLKTQFSRRKDNEKSFFRFILNINSRPLLIHRLKAAMMPIVTLFAPCHTLSYSTEIANTISAESNTVAHFTYKNGDPGFICKSKELTYKGTQFLRTYHHLKLNAIRISHFDTNNHALKRWYDTFYAVPLNSAHIPERFKQIHDNLQTENPVFSHDPNPIKTIMQYNDGYYFLPVFYAIYQHFHQVSKNDIFQDLYQILDPKFHTLLQRLEQLDYNTISNAVTNLTIDTLYYCGNHLYDRPTTMQDKLQMILKHNEHAILSVTTQEQLVSLLRTIQERHFPILVLRLRNALKKPSRHIWNFLIESWQEIAHVGEISDHVLNLWCCIKSFLIDYKKKGHYGGPDDTLIEKFNVNPVVSTIMSDTAMEQKNVQMDAHKWFIRLHGSTMDLLTGHIGGIVPEFFMSDRKLGLDIPRAEMVLLCNDSASLNELYAYLIRKDVFLKYLKELFLDQTDDLFLTLQNIVLEDLPHLNHDMVVTSMMRFYVNLCKCMSYEYDMIVYLMDVLASTLVATNYERKFFVLKGLTRNGKSKLFELMGKILGGYYHSIQSENLAPRNGNNNATPELASTLFSCRMVASEELQGKLNENRVKQITGNSFVTFRNMYEQNTGGIPTAKIFVTTNNYPECNASEAFKDRVVAIPFDANFAEVAPPSTSEQISKNVYARDAFVVEQSHQGGFFMLYHHLKNRMNLEDGLLHYRPEPDYVVEFTEDYLVHADIYVQFKIQMDVQLVPGCMTTMNDVKSAVRQFLKQTKNTAYHETDLFIPFEEEFGQYRRSDIQFESSNYVPVSDISSSTETLEFTSQSLLQQQQQQRDGDTTQELELYGRGEQQNNKRFKKSVETSLVFYEGIVIKNLKRMNLDA
jgi:hypothetical protein